MPAKQLFFLDPLKFDQSTGGDEEIKQAIAEAFIQHTPPLLKELEQEGKNEDMKRVSHLVHKLKASAGLFCVSDLFNEMADIEKNAQGQRSQYIHRINKVIADVHGLIKEIQNIHWA